MSSTLISRRYETKSLLLTTNRPFSEWPQVFPNATCVVSLIDRIIHHAEILATDGESYRARGAGAPSSAPRARERDGVHDRLGRASKP